MLDRSQIVVEVCRFYEGTRDFLIRRQAAGVVDDINPVELLGLPEAAKIIERFSCQNPALALRLALARLLVPCLEYRGNRRHLVLIQSWTQSDLLGESIFAGTRTDHARDLAREQADDYRIVTAGQAPPAGSLAKIFWHAHTELPWLPDSFDDPQLDAFAQRSTSLWCLRARAQSRLTLHPCSRGFSDSGNPRSLNLSSASSRDNGAGYSNGCWLRPFDMPVKRICLSPSS